MQNIHLKTIYYFVRTPEANLTNSVEDPKIVSLEGSQYHLNIQYVSLRIKTNANNIYFF